MYKIDNSLYWGSIVVAKIDDEVFSSIIKIYSYFLFVLSVVPRSSCWEYRMWRSYLENP